MIATGSDDKSAAVWDSATLGRRHLIDHADSVLEVAWSPDGTVLATASQDGTVKLFSATAGTCLAMLLSLSEGWVAFKGDGLHCRMGGDIRGAFGYSTGLCRFEPGEIDPYLPSPLLLPEGTPLFERKR
jgi:WD40 repeat protein